MTRVDQLPPPPEKPVRSPQASVAGERAVTVPGRGGGPSLEARVYAPASATRAVLLCHPHPLYGGSMHSPVPLAIAKALAAERPDVAWMRFDFRSTYDDGRGEVDDARAALDALRRAAPGVKVSVCGHSFGSWVGLRAAIADRGVERVVLVAPSTRFFGFRDESLGFRGPIAIVIGDEDEFCDVDESRALADKLGASLQVLAGFDHHFLKSRRTMAEAVLPLVAPEAPR
jgi:alpha/beta superfamily hydrolase